ncbi:MAG TPA: hypothetical protein VGO47_14560 [Chlamydiales bacterium]|jgi:hypothetical protein|nr:hypothetical protein [Chlamydiales bacterium]
MSIISNWLSKAAPGFFSSPLLPPENSKKPLHMELVKPKDWPIITRKATSWSWKAYKKAVAQPPKSQAHAQLKDCGFICETLVSHLQSISPENRASSENIDQGRVGPQELYVCKDGDDKIHGMALVGRDRTSLVGHLLVTHPRNIPDHKGIRDPRSTKGVGSTADDHINRIAPQRGIQNILLVNSDSSKEFYLKRGYKRTNHPNFTFYKSIKPISAL